MDKENSEKNKSNRRQAFRVYEQVDLVFYKIELEQEQLNNADFSNILNSTVQSFNAETSASDANNSVESTLPASLSHENETLNINISSTGISFTSKEKLDSGDYLMLRVLLLSSMIAITTCCKVVYIKPSNPFENNQYPYTIGVRFINLKPEDKELLDRHVRKKRSRRLTMNVLFTCLVLGVIQAPDLIVELMADLFSFIIDECIEIFHLFYEMVEYSLDQIIEHTFHTDRQSTQTIVFYIQSILSIALLFPLVRMLISSVKKTFKYSLLFLYRKKSSVFYCWGEQTLLKKIGVITLVLLLISVYILFLI